jgi:hypothetical protein
MDIDMDIDMIDLLVHIATRCVLCRSARLALLERGVGGAVGRAAAGNSVGARSGWQNKGIHQQKTRTRGWWLMVYGL